jgi:hypothetical protein
VLWNRSYVASSMILKPLDVVPPLYISPLSFRDILEELSSTDGNIGED